MASLAALHAAEPVTNSIGMKLMPIQPGTFTMGQDGPQTDYKMSIHPGESDRADWDEKPVHKVVISKPFQIGTTEVTVAQYRHFDPQYRQGKGLPDEAASGISWNKAVEFCAWLSKQEGKPYRLPTEAEWEYACRAGTTTVFNTGDKLPDGFLPWFTGYGYLGLFPWSFYFPDNKASPEYLPVDAKKPSLRVAQRAPNAWGLYDMHGNLCEWCSDWYGPYETGGQTDPRGRSDGDFRVFRDGPHSMLSRLVRSANRGAWIPESGASIFGFRVVLGEQPQGSLLPPEPPPKNAQHVKQALAKIEMAPQDEPFFSGPKPFVKIPKGSFGPLFSSHNHSPGITECPNGDLLATWFSTVLEGATELCNAAVRLRFGQSEWEEASPFWDGPDINDHAPKLWWDGDKTIYHIARGHSENIIRTSTDNGATWSKAKPIYPQGETGNGMIRTRAGVLMITQDAGVSLYTSSDNGKSWSATGIQHPKDEIRPGGKGGRHAGIHAPVVELGDGRLMTIGRPHPTAQVGVFSGKALLSFSSDQGHSWTYMESEFPAVTSVQRPVMIRLREDPILLCSFTDQWSEFYKGNRKGMTFKGKDANLQVLQSITRDGGFTWSEPVMVCDGTKLDGKDPCEPYVFRSPDGDELCCIMRENRRSGTSLVIFSRDEGKTWSAPVDTPWGLTGDRHHGASLPDGRLVIVFRNTTPNAKDKGGFIAWVGTYDDIKHGKPGQYRISLLKSFKDGFYPGLHLLPDGTIVTTTYTTYRKDDGGCSIVSVRFKMDEIDALAAKPTLGTKP